MKDPRRDTHISSCLASVLQQIVDQQEPEFQISGVIYSCLVNSGLQLLQLLQVKLIVIISM